MTDAWAELNRQTGLSMDERLWSADERKRLLEVWQGPSDCMDWKNELLSLETNRNRWNAFLNDTATMVSPFRWRHTEVARRARCSPPTIVAPIVTSFTDWIFGLYEVECDIRKLEQGRKLERAVIAGRIPVPEHSRWKLDYDGTSRGTREPLLIPGLLVNGQPLRGKPDLVFREKKRNRVVIVEIKISNASLPSDGWPNLRAQLWAYSKIDWHASEVLLVAEIWAMEARLRRRKTLVWNKSDVTFNHQCSELFDIYRTHADAANMKLVPARDSI